MPQDQPLAVTLLNRKQIEFATQPTMIALLSLFTLLEPRIEFVLRKKRSSIDALHLWSLGITLPVSAGERKQLESFQAIRIRHMRA